MPKISLDMPAEIIADLKIHVGDEKKYVSLADAIRTACRRLLDQLDEIDERHGRIKRELIKIQKLAKIVTLIANGKKAFQRHLVI